MDYQKLFPILALTLGLSAGAAEAMASDVPLIPQGLADTMAQATAPDAATLFTMNEVNGSGVLLAREKGCLASKGCLGVCAGRKPLNHEKAGSSSCSTKAGEANCSGKTGDASKTGDATCAGKGTNIVSSTKVKEAKCASNMGGSSCAHKKGADRLCASYK